jgi:hypothetical protein
MTKYIKKKKKLKKNQSNCQRQNLLKIKNKKIKENVKDKIY